MPGEYAAIGRPQGPDPWKPTDVVATASLVGGIFGKGGGEEVDQAELLLAFRTRFGTKLGTQLFEDFRSAQDPEAPTTIKGQAFPYETKPARGFAKGSVALPDPASVKREAIATDCANSAPPLPVSWAARARRPRRCRTRCSCRAPSPPRATRSRSSARRSPTSRPRSSWSRTSTRRGGTRAAPRSPAST